jgi:hypothetical protein
VTILALSLGQSNRLIDVRVRICPAFHEVQHALADPRLVPTLTTHKIIQGKLFLALGERLGSLLGAATREATTNHVLLDVAAASLVQIFDPVGLTRERSAATGNQTLPAAKYLTVTPLVLLPGPLVRLTVLLA